MYDYRTEIVALAEKALQNFVSFRLHDMGIENTWKNGLKSFVDKEYPLHQANYKKLYVFLQNHDEQEVILEQLDITSLTTLVHFYWKAKGIYEVSPDAVQLFINHIMSIRELRNTFEHYTKELIAMDASKMYYDQLYFTESISSFAILVMKYKSPLNEWKEIYHKARHIISCLHGERWLAVDEKAHVLISDEDMSTVLSLAEEGFIEAQVKAGKVFFYGERELFDREKAYMWFYKAAQKGNPEAEYYVGQCYHKSYGVEYDSETGNKWLRKASDHGYAAAQYELAITLYWGMNNIQNQELSEMIRLLKLSADQNYPEAIWSMGLCYSMGYGVEKNIALGKELKEKSALLGYDFASENLGKEAENKGDFQTALKWYLLAAEQGRNIEYRIKQVKRIVSSMPSSDI